MNPLFQAIENNNPNQLKLLLDLGHDPNKPITDEKHTWSIRQWPLQIAYNKENSDCAKVLLEAGSNPKKISGHVISELIFEWCKVIVAYLDNDDLKELTRASFKKSNAPVIELLVEKQPDIKKKFTPEMLCDAVMRGHQPMAEFLISIGVDVNTADKRFATPLMHAANNNLLETAQLLIEHGAEVNYSNDLNITPLIEAAKNNANVVALLLLEHGADIEITDWEGFTALDHARRRENTKLIFEIEKYLNTQN